MSGAIPGEPISSANVAEISHARSARNCNGVAKVKRTMPRAPDPAQDAPSDKRVLADAFGLPFVQPPPRAHLAHRSAFLPRREPNYLPHGDRAMQGLVLALLIAAATAAMVIWALVHTSA